MSFLYFTKRTITSATATTAASGYPATNVALEAIRRPWRSTSTGANVVTLECATASAVAALFIQDVNFASATVDKSADLLAWSSVGTLTTYADKYIGRRRGLIVVNDATVKALRINIASGTPTDALAYHRIGAAYAFASSVTMPRKPGPDTMQVRTIFPQARTPLPNGKIAIAATGDGLLAVSLPYKRLPDQDVLELVRRARAGTVVLNLAHADYPELVLPLQHVEEQLEESFPQYRVSQFTAELMEVV